MSAAQDWLTISMPDEKLVCIREGKNSFFAYVGLFVILSIILLMILAFSGPLIYFVVSQFFIQSIKYSCLEWAIVIAMSAGMAALGRLAIPIIVSSSTKWIMDIRQIDDFFHMERRVLGFRIKSKMPVQTASLVLKPTYMRGDWGFTIWLRSEKQKRMITPSMVISENIAKAKKIGLKKIQVLSEYLKINYIEESWEKYEQLQSKKRRHT
ncbi:MAG: hypothetical protein GX927_01630 [Lentisphaerae bacterium]|nr:hypothetical protein [Lentisphaerota bacterium]